MSRAIPLLCLVAACMLPAAHAQDPGPDPALKPPRVDDWTATLYLENDSLTGTDRYYTHGTRLSFISPDFEGDVPYSWAHALNPLFGLFMQDVYTHNLSLSIGQELFTPSDTDTRDYQGEDRPYAAWTYLSIGIHGKNATSLHIIDLQIGVVGDYALGEETQNLVHRAVGSSEAQGWDHQISNELAFTITYDYRRRFELLQTAGFDMDLIPRLSVSAGTAHTDLGGGATVRAGWNLPRDWHNNRIRPAADAPLIGGADGPFSIWVFAGAGGKWVIRDITLDGNTYTSGPQVDKEPLVGELEAGIGLRYKIVRLMLSYVERTPTFDEQDHTHRFGAVSLSFAF